MRTTCRAALVLLAAACCGSPLGAAAAGTDLPDETVQSASPQADDASLGELRANATLGDVDASAALASRLLDRFEHNGDRADLHEALQWIARDWDEAPFRRIEMANRVVSGHCVRAALKTHWLCRQAD